jgi:SNF2 family DNA or RNA helicase
MEKFLWFIKKSGIDFKHHQFEGVRWCLQNELGKLPCGSECRGGLIADEMGLGKTITTIGLMISNFMLKTLIVLPNTLIQQWAKEIQRTTGHSPLIFYGAAKKIITFDQLCSAPIVLTSYAMISLKPEKVDSPPENLLHMVTWNRVVFDEAHHMRNKNSRYWGAKKLMSPIKWLISGTPIQNKRRDFYNLCSVIGIPRSYYVSNENMDDLLKNHVLRRTKNEVGIQLPDLESNYNNVDWKTDAERILSEDIHNAIKLADSLRRLQLYLKARQTCILPAMIKNSIPGLIDSLLIPRNPIYYEGLESSSKLDAVLLTLLGRKGNGNGKLVFCHFREEMDFILLRLKEADPDVSVAVFDGRASHKKRSIMLSEPNEYLIIQIQTGCEGLNLQEHFSEVYFVSPNWNPSIEEQAIARCHRIGQKKPVHVFRFQMTTYEPFSEKESDLVPSPSLDQYIQTIQSFKRDISNQIIAS